MNMVVFSVKLHKLRFKIMADTGKYSLKRMSGMIFDFFKRGKLVS